MPVKCATFSIIEALDEHRRAEKEEKKLRNAFFMDVLWMFYGWLL